MTDKIIILDFGSQYTQLIGRTIRENNVYCEIIPFSKSFEITSDVKGVILSGSPFSVNDAQAPNVEVNEIAQYVPVLGVCYGAQLIAKNLGGRVEKSDMREYGRSQLKVVQEDCLFEGVKNESVVWMSHSDSINALPEGYQITATTESIPVAAFSHESGKYPIYGLQFHPEVYHSEEGKKLLKNFLFEICHCKSDWTPAHFVNDTIQEIKDKVGTQKVIMALSGGVDSMVAATLVHRAIGNQLYCIFVNNGVLRANEADAVLQSCQKTGLNINMVDASDYFYSLLKGKTDPEEKRKAIGNGFIEVFDREAHLIKDVQYLGQGTIYPDVIESVSVNGPSVTIKSHHNVGGLPEKMNLKLLEPLRLLFKDEVRRVGEELGIAPELLYRHPFPGPGLAIRILGEVTSEKVSLLQKADQIFIDGLKSYNLYDKVWQAGAILLPVKSVGVMGDERTYESTIALRAVTSVDGMTADWAQLPYEFLGFVSNEIINKVRGINRVVYDISSKPPATIEWE